MNIKTLAHKVVNYTAARPALYNGYTQVLGKPRVCVVGWPGSGWEELFAAHSSIEALEQYHLRYGINEGRPVGYNLITRDLATARRAYAVSWGEGFPTTSLWVLKAETDDVFVQEIKQLSALLKEVENFPGHARVLMTSAQYCALKAIDQARLPVVHIAIGSTKENLWHALAGLWFDNDAVEFKAVFPDVQVMGNQGCRHNFQTSAVVVLNSNPHVGLDVFGNSLTKLMTSIFGFERLLNKRSQLSANLLGHTAQSIPFQYKVNAEASTVAFLNLDVLWRWLVQDIKADTIISTHAETCRPYCLDVLAAQPSWVQQVVDGIKDIGNAELMHLDLAHLIDTTGIPGGYNDAAIAYLEGLGVVSRNVLRYAVTINSIWSAGLGLKRVKPADLKFIF